MATIWGDDNNTVDSDASPSPLHSLSNASVTSDQDEWLLNEDWDDQPDLDSIQSLFHDSSVQCARSAAVESSVTNRVVHLGDGSCLHSEYLASISEYHATGYVGDDIYVLLLHRLPVIAGHTTLRIAVRSTETTIESMNVLVTCNVRENPTAGTWGSKALCQLVTYVVNKMDHNQSIPFKPQLME